MSVEVCVLASGSSGNCTVVRTPGGLLLLDAGIGPRTVSQRLAGTGDRHRHLDQLQLLRTAGFLDLNCLHAFLSAGSL